MSSRLTNVVATQFVAQGGQAIVQQLSNMGQATGTFFNRLNDTSRMSERLNSQWRAIGTTIRYAIAGQAVFGLTSMITQLKDVQQQMGLISAIGTLPGGKPIAGQQLTQMFDDVLKGAQNSLTPVNEYNDAVINLLSTVGEVPQNQITPIVTEISRAAKLSQVSAEDATKAFTTMNVAFGRPTNLKNVRTMAQEFVLLTKLAPGGTAAGGQIIGQLGQLAAVTRVAGGQPQDMFSLLLSSLRGGIPPAQAGRGLQFLLQTIGLPGQQTKSSREALASVGIRPGVEMSAQERLTRIFKHARSLGLKGNAGKLRNIDEDTLGEMESLGPAGTTQALQTMGISGRGAEFLGQVFHRIHSLRTALAIEQQLDVGQAQDDFKTMTDAAHGHVADINKLSTMWKKLADQSQLQQAAIDLETIRLQIAKNVIEPVANPLVRHIVQPVTNAALGHPEATKHIEQGAAALIAALGIGRLLGAGRLTNRIPGLGGLTRILGGPGQAFVRANAIQASISGSTVLGGSPQNPLYVTVVGQLFGGGTPPPTVPGAPGIPGAPPDRTLRRIAPWLAPALERAALPVMAAIAVAGVAKGAMHPERTIREQKKQLEHKGFFGQVGFGMNPWNVFKGIGAGVADDAGIVSRALGIGRGKVVMDLRRAQEIWNKNGNQVTGITNDNIREFTNSRGVHEIAMTITVKHPDGTETKKRVHIPVKLWETKPAPSAKGATAGRR